MKQQDARLGRDGNADLVGEFEPTAAFEVLLGKEDLRMPEQLSLVLRREATKERNVALDDALPLGRKR